MSDISWREAVAFSHNYATAKPDIGLTEKEHILGLCKVLEECGERLEVADRKVKSLEAHLAEADALIEEMDCDD